MSQIGIDTCPSADDGVRLVMVDDSSSLLDTYNWMVPEMLGMIPVLFGGCDEALAYCKSLPRGSRLFLVSDGDLGVRGKNGPDLLAAIRILAEQGGLVVSLRLFSGDVGAYQRDPRIAFLSAEDRWPKGEGLGWIEQLKEGLEELRAKQAPLTHTKPHSISPSTAPSAEG
ncbi:hypothetical protein KBD13_01580 [Patescibacteria group bacterium]|nr:hypothetical protein [Patescibacteria group bacterium]MDQ5919431.1 hypothetical protein [Patescibacteria group bacterium]